MCNSTAVTMDQAAVVATLAGAVAGMALEASRLLVIQIERCEQCAAPRGEAVFFRAIADYSGRLGNSVGLNRVSELLGILKATHLESFKNILCCRQRESNPRLEESSL